VFLHQKEILSDKLPRHSAAKMWMIVMPICPTESDGFAVDADIAIFELDGAEAGAVFYFLAGVTLQALQRDVNVV
jgi:hypothetical protein